MIRVAMHVFVNEYVRRDGVRRRRRDGAGECLVVWLAVRLAFGEYAWEGVLLVW